MNQNQIERIEAADTYWEGPPSSEQAKAIEAGYARVFGEIAIVHLVAARNAAKAGDRAACHAALRRFIPPSIGIAAARGFLHDKGLGISAASAISAALDQSSPDGPLFGAATYILIGSAIAMIQG